MSLVKRGNSKYWYCQFQFNHRVIIRSTKTTDKRLAKHICAAIRSQVTHHGIAVNTKSQTVHEAIDALVQSKMGTANHRNLVGHQRSLCLAISGRLKVEHLTTVIIDHWVFKRRSEGVKPQTIKHGLNLLSLSLKLARQNGHPVGSVHMPKITVNNRRVRYLSAEEQSRLLDLLRTRGAVSDLQAQQGYQLAVVLLDTGARYSEIARLLWDQIDLENNLIRLWRSKVNNESILFMTDRVREVFNQRNRTRTDCHVFAKPLAIARFIRKSIRAANLPGCTIHTLRHTNATLLIQNGISIYDVKHILGHSDIRTTMRYCHIEQSVVTEKAMQVLNRLNTK